MRDTLFGAEMPEMHMCYDVVGKAVELLVSRMHGVAYFMCATA